MTVPIVAIDCETTGLHVDKQVWEVAMIRRDETGERELLMQVRDVDLSNADGYGLKVGGFYDRHAQYRRGGRFGLDPDAGRPLNIKPESDVAKAVEEWTRGAHLIGVNPAFDAGSLDPMLRRHGLLPAWSYHLVDVAVMALGFLNGTCEGAVIERRARMRNLEDLGVANLPPMPEIPDPRTPPWKSDELGRLLGVDAPADVDRHTALGDARWALAIYDRMTTVAR